jgi:hypothetical protein
VLGGLHAFGEIQRWRMATDQLRLPPIRIIASLNCQEQVFIHPIAEGGVRSWIKPPSVVGLSLFHQDRIESKLVHQQDS